MKILQMKQIGILQTQWT